MNKIIVVEEREVDREYGFRGNQVIVDHQKHGRLLVEDGFGGDPQGPNGMCVRWRHGMVISLHKDDTFDILDAGEWNEYTSLWSAIHEGYDESRPIQYWWDGYQIRAMMNKLGYPGG